MARGSGMADDALLPGSFQHELSGVAYRVFLRNGSAWMSYARPATNPKGVLSGERRLEYFIGSGHRGRTYLYQIGNQWFELPINYYSRTSAWDMTPAFENATFMPAPLPVESNCLHCHSTQVQPSLAVARNSFATVPFRQGGIGCSACHGDPSTHIAQHGHGPITNPGKLPAVQRESACLQCHIEGDAVVYRPGRSLAQFIPGDNLADISVYFVRASQRNGGARATSQYEALLNSACKRAVGDKLTCTTCHDPHFDPPAAERAQYFRARCLACHTNPAIALHHFPTQSDCAQCHMPARNTADISHEQVTDHDIEARPVTHAPRSADNHTPETFVPVGGFTAGDREYGLAYAQAAQRGFPEASKLALRFLTNAEQAGASDEEVYRRLGYLNQVAGNIEKARAYYARTLQANPYEPSALTNLAVIDASSHHLDQAIQLLKRLTDNDPSQTAAGLDLAFIECKTNHHADALALLQRLAAVNPDDPQLRNFLEHGTYAGQSCSLASDTHSLPAQ
jgi:hypothetical protein